MNIDVTVDTSEVDGLLQRMPGAFAEARRLALEGIGEALASRARRAFRNESLRPAPWAPRKDAKRGGGHPLLIRSGALRQSIGWGLESFDTVKAGTPFEYGRYLQHGTRNMPARPFFPVQADGDLTPDMRAGVGRAAERAFEAALSERPAGLKG